MRMGHVTGTKVERRVTPREQDIYARLAAHFWGEQGTIAPRHEQPPPRTSPAAAETSDDADRRSTP